MSKKYNYKGKGTQAPYDEDYHFYRDLDPETNPGGDPVGDDNKPLKKGDVPGATEG